VVDHESRLLAAQIKTTASFFNITNSVKAINVSPGVASSHKRIASQAQLVESHSNPSASPSTGSVDNMQNFKGTFSTLPLLMISEETYIPGPSYGGSPRCSSASDSTYSTHSDGFCSKEVGMESVAIKNEDEKPDLGNQASAPVQFPTCQTQRDFGSVSLSSFKSAVLFPKAYHLL
jgi:hypothetical protein